MGKRRFFSRFFAFFTFLPLQLRTPLTCITHSIHTRGLVDLRPLAQHYGYEPRGLADLSKNILGLNLDKNPKIRCSRWGDKDLSAEQIEYAALDAWIGHKLSFKFRIVILFNLLF